MFRTAFIVIFGSFVMCNAMHLQSITYDGILDNEDISLSPFTKVGEKYYFTDKEKKLNWFDAANTCRRMGGHLASVETEDEMKELIGYLEKMGLASEWVWLGGNDLSQENNFIWLATGKPFSYTNWAHGEPSNHYGNEHCVLVWIDHLWNDGNCKSNFHSVCQADAPKTISVTVW